MTLSVVIMAAGKGTRMKSLQPKVLHRIAAKPMLAHVIETVRQLAAQQVVVVTGHGAQQVEDVMAERFGKAGLTYVRQEPQLGTGHAVQQAVPVLPDEGVTLILNGDVPLIREATARALVDACAGQHVALLTVMLDDPTGYGRIVREGAEVKAIVEEKDANSTQRGIREVYTGMMAAPTRWLKEALAGLRNDNAQGEYYLTDVVGLAVAQGVKVMTAQPKSLDEVLGVNSPAQLADLERRHQLACADELMVAGVRLADPARLDVRGLLTCGQDVEIDVNCIFEGEVHLGDGVKVGANCIIAEANIQAGTVIHPFTHIDGRGGRVVVGADSVVGPYARLRPGAVLGPQVHIGNFVEVKNSTMAAGAKANHLAYLGDATVGERVNYGAGSITANYDGANKHRTVIGNDVHVGSNCVLIAPVVIGDGATIGGGSTITKDAPAGQLTVARAKALSVAGWQRPVKKSKQRDE